jgi:hypothetical protein
MQKEETLTTPSRPAVLKRPALAAALASLSLGVYASASEPTNPAPQPAATTASSPLDSLFKALSSDKPLFLVQDGDPATRAASEDALVNGVQKYPTGGFFGFESDHSDSSLRIGALGQFRANFSYFEPFGGGDEEFENGFEMTRLQMHAGGQLGSPNLTYFVQSRLHSSEGGFELLDAWAAWRQNDNIGMRVGQFKDPLTQEGLMYSGRTLVSERSLAYAVLADSGRVQGASLLFAPSDTMRGEVAIHDGFGSANTQFLDSDTHIGVTGRLEMLLQGAWDDYEDFTAAGTDENMFVVGVGAGVSWPDSDDRFSIVTVDAQYENSDGVGAFGAVYVSPSRVGGEDTFNIGATAQVGFLMDNKFEPFARASMVQLDDDVLPAGFEDTYFEITGGVNWYPVQGMGRHRVKLTADVNILPNGSPGSFAFQGYEATDEMEIVLRTQAQIDL